MTESLPAADAALALPRIPLEPLDAGPGSPPTGIAELGSWHGVDVGVWEMSEGEAYDTEAEELFVVLSGAGRIDFLDSGQSLELAPGDLVRLAAGSRTRWTITRTLRKLYLAPGED